MHRPIRCRRVAVWVGAVLSAFVAAAWVGSGWRYLAWTWTSDGRGRIVRIAVGRLAVHHGQVNVFEEDGAAWPGRVRYGPMSVGGKSTRLWEKGQTSALRAHRPRHEARAVVAALRTQVRSLATENASVASPSRGRNTERYRGREPQWNRDCRIRRWGVEEPPVENPGNRIRIVVVPNTMDRWWRRLCIERIAPIDLAPK
jgi:hypothetical protein